MHRDQHRRAAALDIGRAHGVPRRLGRDHHHIEIGPGHDLPVVDVESMRERERRALADVGLDLFAVDRGDVLVGHQHHHEVGTPDSVRDGGNLEPRLFRLVPGRAAGAQPNGHLDAGIV